MHPECSAWAVPGTGTSLLTFSSVQNSKEEATITAEDTEAREAREVAPGCTGRKQQSWV